MANIIGTSGNDSITPAGVSPGVTGGVPSDDADSILGGAGDDLLRGRGGGDTLDGGEGDDRLLGDHGNDGVFGGADNDTVVIRDLGFYTIDGGTGADRLKVAEAGVDFDFTTTTGGVGGRVTGIETLDLRGGDHTVTLDAASVLALGSDTGKLKLLGGNSDSVILTSAFTASGQQVRGATTFNVFKDGGATVWIADTVDVILRPGFDLADLDGSNGFVLNGIDAFDDSGYSVSGAGDVNGDGYDDVIIGTEAPNQLNAGESYVVFGSGNPFDAAIDLADLDGSNGFKLNGIDTGDYFGISVSGAGDVNGDGYDDLIVGANGADPNGNNYAGESYVVFGSGDPFDATFELSDLDGSNGFVINGIDPYDDSGRSVSDAGDVNGDGFDDVIIGAWYGDPSNQDAAGESYVVFGSGDPFPAEIELADLDGSNGFKLNGIDVGDYSGRSVSGAGDVNGDGFDDVIVGAYRASPGDDIYNLYAGESYVVFGSGDPFDAAIDLSDLDGGNGFVLNGIEGFSGWSVSGAGDVNGDGFDDVIIGAREAGPAGESYVVFGSGDAFDATFELSDLDGSNGFALNGINARDDTGFSVSGAGDVNGDGYDDVIIGAPDADANGVRDAGEAYVVFGSGGPFDALLELSDLDGSNGFVLDGIDQFDNCGYSVSGAGDVNNDGYDDLIIGAPRSAGESYVVFGGSSIGVGGALTVDLSADLGADLTGDDPLLL